MENQELSKSFQQVFAELNKNIGMFIKVKEVSIAKICTQCGINADKYAKYLSKALVKAQYMEKKGAGVGVQMKIIKEIPASFADKCAKEFKETKRIICVSTSKKASKTDAFLAVPKTYSVGQPVYCMNDNKIEDAMIIGINIPDENLDKIMNTGKLQNNEIQYRIYIPLTNTKKDVTIYDFSDTIDGLCSMIKYTYSKSKH